MRNQIQGRCPACDWAGSIFVGAGGYLTCSRETCSNPCAPSEALGVKFPDRPSKVPSSPVGEPEPSARPLVPEEAIETDWCAHTTLARHYREERNEALALVVDLQTGLVEALATITQRDAEVERLNRVLQVIMATSDDERAAASKAGRDARDEIARLKFGRDIEQTMIRSALEHLVAKDDTIQALTAEKYRLTIAVQDANTKHEILREFDRKSIELAHEFTDEARRERDKALGDRGRLTAEAVRLSNLLHLTLDERNERDATIARMRTGRITIAQVDAFLEQAKQDRDAHYWGPGPHEDTLGHVETWLLSLKDWL